MRPGRIVIAIDLLAACLDHLALRQRAYAQSKSTLEARAPPRVRWDVVIPT
jgi:hypothetical protein